MFEFKNKQRESLEERITELERQVKGQDPQSPSMYSILGFWNRSYTLKNRVDDLQKILAKQEKLTHLIMDHLKLEYVKITEENGSTEVKEILRPASKKKKDKEVNDCECCDYA